MEGIKQQQFYLVDNNLFKTSRCFVGCFCFPVSSHINHPFPMVQPAFFTLFFPHFLWICGLKSLMSCTVLLLLKNPFLFASVITAFHTHPFIFPNYFSLLIPFPRAFCSSRCSPHLCGLCWSNARTNIQQISSSSNTMGGALSSPKQKLDKKLFS